jgi:RHS repeat-associated protein
MSDTIDIRRLNKPASPTPRPEEGVQKETGGIWAFLNKDIRLFGSSIPDKVREGFYMELSTLLEAGVDIRAQDPGGDGSSNGFFPDAYGEVLDYYSGDYSNPRAGVANIAGVNSSAVPAFYTGGAADSYAGNVKAMSWFSQKTVASGASSAPNAYVYQYDNKYQFVGGSFSNSLTFGTGQATYATTNFNQEVVGNAAGNVVPYDGNGNIQYLQRTNATGAMTDQFSYQYGNGNNQLTQVTNVATSQAYATYSYDANGQLTMESKPGSNPIYLSYDMAGNVTGEYQDQQLTLPLVTFVYDENGMRVKKVDYSISTNLPTFVYYYVGDVIYKQTVTNGTSYGAASPLEYQIRGINRIGIYEPLGPIYAYELTDHLGSVRAVVTKNASTLQVTAYSDYYPFGEVLAKDGNDRYGYQGQYSEADGETGWNAFQLRMYDSRIARWLRTDPAGQFFSPYEAMGNNPISGVDPDGGWMPPTDPGDYCNGDVWSDDEGNWVYNDGVWQGVNGSPDFHIELQTLPDVVVSPTLGQDISKGVKDAAYNAWNSDLVREYTPDFVNIGGDFLE